MTTDAPLAAPPAALAEAAPLDALPDLSGRPALAASETPLKGALGMLADIEIELTVEFGRRRIPLSQIASLEIGSVVELDSLAGEPLVIFANGRRIATGEAVVVDGLFGVRIQSMGA